MVTGIRDYIHVMDLASGHVAALNLLSSTHVKLKVINMRKHNQTPQNSTAHQKTPDQMT